MRINKGQEFVIGGYTVGGATFDAWSLDIPKGPAALCLLTRNGFTPRVREELLKRFRGLESSERPFADLPAPRAGRPALTALLSSFRQKIRIVGLVPHRIKWCESQRPAASRVFKNVPGPLLESPR